jgi:ribonuclease HII
VKIDDSKRLSVSARRKAFEAIVRVAEVGIGWVGPEQIDRVGIGRATDLAMLQAITRLPRVPQLVMVDGKRVPFDCSTPAVPVVRGDGRSLRIACASIVAKVLRDRWMERLDRFYPEYGFLKHKGYGTRQHLRALRWLGPSCFHRFSFRPIRPSTSGRGVVV